MNCYRSRHQSKPRKVLEEEREYNVIQIYKLQLHEVSHRNFSCTNQLSAHMNRS